MADEEWIRLTVALPAGAPAHAEDVLSGLLPELGAHGLELPVGEGEPSRIVATFREAEDPGALVDRVRAALAPIGLGALALSAAIVPLDDWAPFWAEAFEPLRFGPLAIVPSWADPPADAAHVLIIDPSQAFGTGLHPTTALCLEALVADPPQGRVLDVGTGSGVLALAALALGAERAVGVDVDPVAVEAARHAAEENDRAADFEVRAGDARIEGEFEVVLANLRPRPLIDGAKDLRARLAPGGRLIVSGVRIDELEPVQACFRREGLEVAARAERDRWVQLTSRARP